VTSPSQGKRAPEQATGFPAAGFLPTDSPDSSASGSRATDSPAAGPLANDSLATEARLVGRAQAGDVDAFERLSSAYAGRVFMLLLRLLGDRDEAEDVAQEVMLRAWQGITHFQGRSSYFTWLYRIAVNEASRALEKRGRRPPGVSIGADELQLPASPALEPSRQAEASELRAILGRALADLPPPLRTAIVLRDVEGLSTQEAAEITGVSQAAFKSRLHQARLRVRAAVGDDALITAGR
jgi:RNA polymerase sigma-70 factor (ECF subfamily)